jgi:hypothetical protein
MVFLSRASVRVTNANQGYTRRYYPAEVYILLLALLEENEGGKIMGYFSNGCEGLGYEEQYCSKCVHAPTEDTQCAVLEAHGLYNYDECNKKDSILHILIPRDEHGYNEQCKMFLKGVR